VVDFVLGADLPFIMGRYPAAVLLFAVTGLDQNY